MMQCSIRQNKELWVGLKTTLLLLLVLIALGTYTKTLLVLTRLWILMQPTASHDSTSLQYDM